MRLFSPYHVTEFYQSSGFTRKRKNNIHVKCYRWGQIGHIRKRCNSDTKKQKSMKNIAKYRIIGSAYRQKFYADNLGQSLTGPEES